MQRTYQVKVARRSNGTVEGDVLHGTDQDPITSHFNVPDDLSLMNVLRAAVAAAGADEPAWNFVQQKANTYLVYVGVDTVGDGL